MPNVIVILKNGSTVEVPGADAADWSLELKYPGAKATNAFSAHTIRLVCKQADLIIGRFEGSDVAGYAVDFR